MIHRWTSHLTSILSPLMSYPTRSTGAHKVLFQLLKIKVTVVHAGHFPPLPFLNHTPPFLPDFSSIFLPSRSQHVLLILTSVVALATASVQLIVLLLTTWPKARACMRSSNTLTPHTMALKAHAQFLNSKPPRYKFQASSSLLQTTISN